MASKKKTEKDKGFGKSIPPLQDNVAIYFLEKEATVDEAENFFRHFEDSRWRNKRGRLLSNWKAAAWGWILKLH